MPRHKGTDSSSSGLSSGQRAESVNDIANGLHADRGVHGGIVIRKDIYGLNGNPAQWNRDLNRELQQRAYRTVQNDLNQRTRVSRASRARHRWRRITRKVILKIRIILKWNQIFRFLTRIQRLRNIHSAISLRLLQDFTYLDLDEPDRRNHLPVPPEARRTGFKRIFEFFQHKENREYFQKYAELVWDLLKFFIQWIQTNPKAATATTTVAAAFATQLLYKGSDPEEQEHFAAAPSEAPGEAPPIPLLE